MNGLARLGIDIPLLAFRTILWSNSTASCSYCDGFTRFALWVKLLAFITVGVNRDNINTSEQMFAVVIAGLALGISKLFLNILSFTFGGKMNGLARLGIDIPLLAFRTILWSNSTASCSYCDGFTRFALWVELLCFRAVTAHCNNLGAPHHS